MNDITNNLTLGKTHRWKKNRVDYGDLKKKLYEVASSVAHFREDTTRPFYTDFQKWVPLRTALPPYIGWILAAQAFRPPIGMGGRNPSYIPNGGWYLRTPASNDVIGTQYVYISYASSLLFSEPTPGRKIGREKEKDGWKEKKREWRQFKYHDRD